MWSERPGSLIVNHGTTQGTYWWYIYEGANTLNAQATVTLPIPGTTPRLNMRTSRAHAILTVTVTRI